MLLDIDYREQGSGYVVCKQFTKYTRIIGHRVVTPYYEIDLRGKLTVKTSYWADGASGPAIDTQNFARGWFIHDCLYQMIRQGDISKKYRKKADELLRKVVIQDGMSRFRAGYVYYAVRAFGWRSC